jgi:hypothetical protein
VRVECRAVDARVRRCAELCALGVSAMEELSVTIAEAASMWTIAAEGRTGESLGGTLSIEREEGRAKPLVERPLVEASPSCTHSLRSMSVSESSSLFASTRMRLRVGPSAAVGGIGELACEAADSPACGGELGTLSMTTAAVM